MSRASPGRHDTRFDAFRLAAQGAALAGKLDAGELPRLEDVLDHEAPAGGAIEWRIAGGHDALGHPALTIELEGAVPVVCQRCLAPFAWPVSRRNEVLLARTEDELARLDESGEAEVVLAAAPLDPAALVEDELLLTLPYAPRHPGECPPQ